MARKQNKVLVFGVFDFLHAGHISFLRQAKKLGRFLIVSVARDDVVLGFKGHWPVLPEQERLQMLRSLRFVDKVVLGELDTKRAIASIMHQKPDVIALGYDQNPYLAKNDKALERLLTVKVVRLKSYKPAREKTDKIRKFSGIVKKHLGRGTRLGFPTANISVNKNISEGIYVALADGRAALAFIGPSLTFDEKNRKAEVYILDWQGDLYGKRLEIELFRKIRNNQKFKSEKDLIVQMRKDEKRARQFFTVK